jgi:vacuolar-type H+-ATPase subunit H
MNEKEEKVGVNSTVNYDDKTMNASHGTGTYWSIPIPRHVVEGLGSMGLDYQNIIEYSSNCLSVGYNILQMQGNLISTDQLSKVMNEGNQKVQDSKDEILDNLAEFCQTLSKLRDESLSKQNSELSSLLTEILSKAQDSQQQLTDSSNKNSIQNLVGETVTTVMDDLRKDILKSLDISVKDSAGAGIINVIQTAMMTLHANQVKMNNSLTMQTEAMKDALGLNALLKEAESNRQGQGYEFEDLITEQLTIVAGNFNDTVESVGTDTDQIGASKVGDNKITISSSSGITGCIAVEVKSGFFTLSGKNSIQSQLQTAMVNQGAVASIGIVSSKKAPKSLERVGYIRPQPSMHILVVDEDDDEFFGLKCLYPVVRELLIANANILSAADNSIDHIRIIEICEENISKLTHMNRLRRNLRKQISTTAMDIASELSVLQNEMTESFQTLISLHRGGHE